MQSQENRKTGERTGDHSPPRVTRVDLAERLPRAIRAVKSLAPQFETEKQRLLTLQKRLQQGRFHFAVLGQFKRGKSTLLNALLGESLLPTSVVPITAIPTFIQSDGGRKSVRIHFLPEESQPHEVEAMDAESLQATLTRFTSEEANPRNRLQVSYAEVFYPAPLLQKGVVLIDTPGIGSTFQHNTAMTLQFLPQCDAALFLISADPPISETEISFLQNVQEKVPNLYFILNKKDYLSAAELDQAVNFFQRVLRDQAEIKGPKIFAVSAKLGLTAKRSEDTEQWRQSGMDTLESYLVDFFITEKDAALQRAIARKTISILAEIQMQINLMIRALELPLNELQKKLDVFSPKIQEVERARLVYKDTVSGDHQRTKEELETAIRDCERDAREYLDAVLEKALEEAHGSPPEKATKEALTEAIPPYFETCFSELYDTFQQQVTKTLEPHQQSAEALIDSVRRHAADIFEIPYHAPESSRAYYSRRKPRWETQHWETYFSPVPPGFFDSLLPRSLRRKIVRSRMTRHAQSLVTNNVENLRWAMIKILSAAFSLFAERLDARLQETIAATQGAIQVVIEKRRHDSTVLMTEKARLIETFEELSHLRKDLQNQTGEND